jgi:hypothetical protein
VDIQTIAIANPSDGRGSERKIGYRDCSTISDCDPSNDGCGSEDKVGDYRVVNNSKDSVQPRDVSKTNFNRKSHNPASPVHDMLFPPAQQDATF